MAPELGAASPAPSWAAAAPKLRLFDANVYAGNRSMDGCARQIRVDHPDLMTLEEATPADFRQLVADGAGRHCLRRPHGEQRRQ